MLWGMALTFDTIVSDLLAATNASRVTLRLAVPGQGFPVVAEDVSPGVSSIRLDVSPSLTNAPTVDYLAKRRENLIQNDCLSADVRPPAELLELYGVKAQMLGPVLRGQQLIGIVSVHYIPGPRHWTDEEVRALNCAVRAVEQIVERSQT
jgi:maleate isomerase